MTTLDINAVTKSLPDVDFLLSLTLSLEQRVTIAMFTDQGWWGSPTWGAPAVDNVRDYTARSRAYRAALQPLIDDGDLLAATVSMTDTTINVELLVPDSESARRTLTYARPAPIAHEYPDPGQQVAFLESVTSDGSGGVYLTYSVALDPLYPTTGAAFGAPGATVTISGRTVHITPFSDPAISYTPPPVGYMRTLTDGVRVPGFGVLAADIAIPTGSGFLLMTETGALLYTDGGSVLVGTP